MPIFNEGDDCWCKIYMLHWLNEGGIVNRRGRVEIEEKGIYIPDKMEWDTRKIIETIGGCHAGYTEKTGNRKAKRLGTKIGRTASGAVHQGD